MFACVDTTQYICRFLGANDVIALSMVDHKIHIDITPLLEGMSISKYATEKHAHGTNIVNTISIPLLGIKDVFPVRINADHYHADVKIICRIPDLGAETTRILAPGSGHIMAPMCIYTIYRNVKYVLWWWDTEDCIKAFTPKRTIKLLDLINKLINCTLASIVTINDKLERAIVGTRWQIPISPQLMIDEVFLRFIVAFDT